MDTAPNFVPSVGIAAPKAAFHRPKEGKEQRGRRLGQAGALQLPKASQGCRKEHPRLSQQWGCSASPSQRRDPHPLHLPEADV